jgi:hypothetical protein
MPLAAGFAFINIGNDIAVIVIAVGVDAGKRAHRAGGGERAGALAVGRAHALATLNNRQHFLAGNDNGFQFSGKRRIIGQSFVPIRYYRHPGLVPGSRAHWINLSCDSRSPHKAGMTV